MTLTGSPAMMMTRAPAMAIRAAVPRSGCMATRPTGSRMMPASTINEVHVGGSGRSRRYHAQIIGTASFMSSDGWNLTIPRSSHRWAPLPM